MRSFRSPLCLAAALSMCISCAPPADRPPVESPEDPVSGTLALDDLGRTLEILHEKFTSLAEAMPEEDLGWRPMEGVRSVEEVYIHVAADNWYVPALMGWPAPDETGVTEDVATFREYQAREMTRDEMLTVLDASFDFMRSSLADSDTRTGDAVTLGGQETTVGDVWIRAIVHLHEHLGQSIAYARVHEIVPPWSR